MAPGSGVVEPQGARRVAGGVLGVRIVALAVNLAGAVALARALGPDLRGAQALFTTGAFVAALLLTAGANTGGYLLVTRRGVEPAMVGVTALAHGLAAGLATLGVAMLLRLSPDPLASSVPAWPAPLALAVGALVVNGHHIMLALAQGRGQLGAALSVTPYVVAAVAYIAAAASGRLDLGTAVWSFAVGSVVACLVATWPRTRLRVVALSWPSPSTALAMARVGIGGAMTDVVTLLHQRVDVFLLGALAPLVSTGAYVVAYQTAEPLWALLSAGAVAALTTGPAIDGEPRRPSTATAALIRQTALLAGLLALAGALVLPRVVPLVYGRAFQAATLPLLLLLPGIAAFSVGRVAGAHLVRNALLGHNARLATIALAANVAVNLAMIPPLGAVGAALASLGSYSLYAVLALAAFTRTSGTPWPELVPRRADMTAGLKLVLQPLRRARRPIDRLDGTAGQ
jgi:O-antigen/teichoic acid export membrane protein